MSVRFVSFKDVLQPEKVRGTISTVQILTVTETFYRLLYQTSEFCLVYSFRYIANAIILHIFLSGEWQKAWV